MKIRAEYAKYLCTQAQKQQNIAYKKVNIIADLVIAAGHDVCNTHEKILSCVCVLNI